MATPKQLNAILDKEDREKEKEIKSFLETASLLFLGMNGIQTYLSISRQFQDQVNQFVINYQDDLRASMETQIRSLAPRISDARVNQIIDDAFNRRFTIKGTNRTIDLDEVIFRHGQKLQKDFEVALQAINGYDQPSQANLNQAVNTALKKNQKSFARISGNELHKVMNESIIQEAAVENSEEPDDGELPIGGIGLFGVKLLKYNTQLDNRVRPTHAAQEGRELTISEAQQLQSTLMSEPNCRCFLTSL